MNYKYSPQMNGFYSEYLDSPDDAVLCPRERYLETRNPPIGKIRQPGQDGLPVLVDDPEYRLPSLADFVDVKYASISRWRDDQEAENLLFEHAGHHWDGGGESKKRMEETLALANALGLPEGFFWTTAANVDVTLDQPALQALANAMAAARGLRGFEIHTRQRQMKAEVAALANLGESPTEEQLAAAIAAIQAYPVGWSSEVPA